MNTEPRDHVTSASSDGVSRTSGRLTRRGALSSVATVGLTLPLLTACAQDTSASAPGGLSGPSEATQEGDPEAPLDGALAATADIPVGSGVIFSSARVVVTQPEAGDFRCFSAVCTHTGCLVTGIGETITCPCHGSQFDIATGEVLGGPAPGPLPQVDFTVENDEVVLS